MRPESNKEVPRGGKQSGVDANRLPGLLFFLDIEVGVAVKLPPQRIYYPDQIKRSPRVMHSTPTCVITLTPIDWVGRRMLTWA
jgi:hypothetical protein